MTDQTDDRAKRPIAPADEDSSWASAIKSLLNQLRHMPPRQQVRVHVEDLQANPGLAAEALNQLLELPEAVQAHVDMTAQLMRAQGVLTNVRELQQRLEKEGGERNGSQQVWAIAGDLDSALRGSNAWKTHDPVAEAAEFEAAGRDGGPPVEGSSGDVGATTRLVNGWRAKLRIAESELAEAKAALQDMGDAAIEALKANMATEKRRAAEQHVLRRRLANQKTELRNLLKLRRIDTSWRIEENKKLEAVESELAAERARVREQGDLLRDLSDVVNSGGTNRGYAKRYFEWFDRDKALRSPQQPTRPATDAEARALVRGITEESNARHYAERTAHETPAAEQAVAAGGEPAEPASPPAQGDPVEALRADISAALRKLATFTDADLAPRHIAWQNLASELERKR
jgi:hypothetical protein